jgi:carboxyl-terminal processing protease
MQQRLTRAGLFLVALFTTVFGTLALIPPRAASSANLGGPQQIYYRAWQLVKDNYYEPTFNNQDWETWHHKFDGKLNSDVETYTAIKQMLGSLNDQYTRFLDPKSFSEEDDAINSVVCGIGISLKPYQQTHSLIINDVIEGGPAAQGGLAYGDEIIGIDGQPTTGLDTEKAADRIRGKAGTNVRLQVKRATTAKIDDIALVRQQVCIPAVTVKTLPNNVGYIKLATFMSDDASVEFRWALQKLAGTQGIIVDLRDNPGGLLANAIEISDMLMPHGKIVTTVSRKGRLTDACSGGMITNQPIVVMVDGDSASASEILAGALKDNARATIVGAKTFGKGLVQEINRLPGGAGMHITVARYYTPNGSDINKIGIKPDVEQTDHNKQLDTAMQVLQTKIAEARTNNGAPYGIIATPPKRYGLNNSVFKQISPRS